MENQVPVPEPEKESVYQRLKRQIEQAREDERRTLLKLVQRFAPDTLPHMQEIKEVEALRSAVEEVLVERLKR